MFFFLFFCLIASADESVRYNIGEITAQTAVNVRSNSSKTAKILGALRPHATFAVELKEQWYVILDGTYTGGYVAKEFITLTGEKYPLNKTTTDAVRIRAGPSTGSEVRGDLGSGQTFAGEPKGDWFEIKDGAHRGEFVNSKFVHPLDVIAAPEPIVPALEGTERTIKVDTPTTSPTPAASPSPQSTPTPALTPSSQPNQVMAPTPLTTAPPVTNKVVEAPVMVEVSAATNVRIRALPSLKGRVTQNVRPGEIFEVEKAGDWYKIKSGPRKGNYISADFVKPVEIKAETTGASLPTAAPTPALILPAKTVPTTEASSTDLPTLKAKVVAQTPVHIRTQPSAKSRIAQNVQPGEKLEVRPRGEWFEIVSGPHKGNFIAAAFVKTEEPPPTSPQATANAPAPPPISGQTSSATTGSTLGSTSAAPVTSVNPQQPSVIPNSFLQARVISKEAAEVRMGPSEKSFSTGMFVPGTSLEVLPDSPGWYKIMSGIQKDNFIAAPLLKILNPSELPKNPPTDIPSAAAWDSKTEKIFDDQVAKAFKKKAKPGASEDVPVSMPIYYENRSALLSHADTRVRPGQPLIVEASPLFKQLHLLVIPAWFDRPEIKEINPDLATNAKDADDRRWVSLDKFAKSEVSIVFNEQRLEIYISVPAALRTLTVASILKSNLAPEDPSLADAAAGFSTYLNVNGSEAMDTRYTDMPDRRLPLKAQLENGTNIGGVVLEANGSYLENRVPTPGQDSAFTRGDVRVVKDFPDHVLRTTAGDLIYPTQGFQTFRQMGGVSLTSQFSMARSKLTYPTGNYEVFLQRNSKVYIWVNDQLQQVLDLPAGRHNLQDFPFTNGMNELRLQIIDDVGREENQIYSYFSSTELLRPELHQYSYAFGAPSTDVGSVRTYNSNDATLSLFHRYGLWEDLTIGTNLQHDKQQSVLGGEALWSAPQGFFKFQPAISTSAGEGSGGAFQTNYVFSDYKGQSKTQRSYNLGVFIAQKTFTAFSTAITSTVSKVLELTAGYSQGITRNTSLNAGGALRYFNTKDGLQNAFVANIGGNRRWDNGLSASATMTHTKAEAGAEDISIFLFLLWSFPKEKQIVSAISNSSDSSTRLDWSYNPSTGADSANYGASIRDSKTEQGYSGQMLYDGNRARTSISEEVILSKQPDPAATGASANQKVSNNVTTVTVGTSIAYAGGHVAIGRPISDSFAIIAPVDNLKGQRLDINPNGEDSYIAKSDGWGPALLPELGSYNFTALEVSGRNLPSQLTLPRDHFSVFPSYKSGYAFEVGTDATVYLTGKILAPDGTALSLAAGTAIYLDDTKRAPITIFTNKKGVLRSEGFKAGHYRLEISTESFVPIEITIPESSGESFDMGTVQLKAK